METSCYVCNPHNPISFLLSRIPIYYLPLFLHWHWTYSFVFCIVVFLLMPFPSPFPSPPLFLEAPHTRPNHNLYTSSLVCTLSHFFLFIVGFFLSCFNS